MRYKMIDKEPKNYEQRIIKKFLLFPKELYLDNLKDREVRWLEKCEIEQFYSKTCNKWIDFKWID